MSPSPLSPRVGVLATVGAMVLTSLVAAVGGVAQATPLGGSPSRPPGAVVAAPMTSTGSTSSHLSVLEPVSPTVRSYPVTGVSPAAVSALATSDARRTASSYAGLSAPEPAHGVAVTGATWTGKAPAGLTLEVRTRTTGSWSHWTTLAYDVEHGPSVGSQEAANARPGTDPFVAGDVDDVQLRALSETGALPRGLALTVIDPGASRLAEVTSSKQATARTARPPRRCRWGPRQRRRRRSSTPVPRGVRTRG